MGNVTLTAFTGNLTADPEYRPTTGGTPVCSMRVAANKGPSDGQPPAGPLAIGRVPVDHRGDGRRLQAKLLRVGRRVLLSPLARAAVTRRRQRVDQGDCVR